MRENSARRSALVITLIALTVVLSPVYFPVGTTKCYPFQHMVNAIAGILLGPWVAAFMAIVTGTIRNMLGLGTVYAFPGGIPGGLVVGLVRRYLVKKDYAALTEPLGTVVVGATLSAFIVAPLQGHALTWAFFWAAFGASSIPGSALGFLILRIMRRRGLVERLVQGPDR
ncbi:MAG: energy coupling factor transporter S component ThiW [Candidatus Bathyarchaeia archaeon]